MMFDFTDALILQSIYSSEGDDGAELKTIIAYADYVNHAVMAYEELSQTLMKLGRLGLVFNNQDKLKTAQTFKDWWARKYGSKKRIYVLKQISEIEKYLNRIPETAQSPGLHGEVKIEEEYFNQAVDAYLSLFKAKTK